MRYGGRVTHVWVLLLVAVALGAQPALPPADQDEPTLFRLAYGMGFIARLPLAMIPQLAPAAGLDLSVAWPHATDILGPFRTDPWSMGAYERDRPRVLDARHPAP